MSLRTRPDDFHYDLGDHLILCVDSYELSRNGDERVWFYVAETQPGPPTIGRCDTRATVDIRFGTEIATVQIESSLDAMRRGIALDGVNVPALTHAQVIAAARQWMDAP